ncbi:Transposase [Roseomonas mucosa]|uniref:Transposase n=3 Tax=Roseomonas TaxID=125216 RepID=A0A4Y1MZC3_9PROT|nr:transposase [Roseomonas mucosa]AWV20597.1 Transposase [Roseomonas mucosa]AWV22956.1 Transposase [Roseomonas mucosa]AWV23362.1 Transposase [Roseomonas mucosa]AWV24330.1 Transposase [Roseomonas mucosa]MDU7521578.1 transposase [Roseomonas mucosa]
MLHLPPRFAAVILSFAPLFFHRSWQHAEVLLIGAILAPGKRTVTSLLRISGLAQERRFVNYHRVLNRAVWSPRAASRLLLAHLITAFAPDGPVILGIDDTIERRRGKRIAAMGIYRDPVRSSHGHFVKASGLRWISLMLLAPVPWAGRVWALPFLSALAPSERFCREQGQRHKKLTDWACQLILQARRWLPERDIVLVGDSGFAALELLAALTRHRITGVTRLRLDAALYDPAPPRLPGTNGRPRTKGARRPTLAEVLVSTDTRWQRVVVPGWYGEGARHVEICSATAVWRHGGMPIVPIRWVLVRDPHRRFEPQALLCTEPDRTPEQILCWFIHRWQLEVTFQETRVHLGVETQRQWSDLAIARTTPCLLGLFSLVTLLAVQLRASDRKAAASSAWYRKERPTFSDTLAAVRRHIWCEQGFLTSRHSGHGAKPPRALQHAWAYAICHAA